MSSSHIQLIVGLGNPGKEHEKTRHNAGSWFVESLAEYCHQKLRLETKYHGLHGQVELHGHRCHLLVPTTFMNLSGQAVGACASYLNIPPSSILVAHDEIDLPVGTIKLKFDGGDAGNNGLKDIIRHLHTKQFYRLRIGVGRPTQSKDVVDYVLSAPSKTERLHIDHALLQIHDVLPLILEGEMQKAMHKLHSNLNEI